MKLTYLSSIFPLVPGILLTSDSEATGSPFSRNLASIQSTSCDPSTTDNTIIHAGDSVTLNELSSPNLDDGYVSWVSKSSYENSLYIPTSSDDCIGMGFHWTIDKDQSIIQIAAAVQTDGNNRSGWAAVGFSENGGMQGADVVFFTSSSSTVADGYILDELVRPTLDNSQDWELIDYTITEDGYLIFEAYRALDTKDPFDRPFVDDTSIFVTDHRLIGAWGSSPTMVYHGTNRVRSSIQLFTPEDINGDETVLGAGSDYENFKQETSANSDGSGVIALSNYEIPAANTTYHIECFNTTDLIASGILNVENGTLATRYIVGYEIILKPETDKFLHHAVIYGSRYGCASIRGGEPVIAWAPGEDFQTFPPGVGMKYGGSPDSYTSFFIEYHFDNHDLESGIVDTGSGIRLYYTDGPVNNELGLFQVGDPLVHLEDQAVGSGLTKHTFTCPSSCSQTFISDEVTVIKESLHMHATGKRIANQVLRDDEVIHETYIDYWDFDQSGGPSSQKSPYQLQKGDSFRTVCYYDADSDTKFGLGSQDEMCITFIYYFPKQMVPICGVGFAYPPCQGSYDGVIDLSSEKDLGRVFASTSNTAAPTPSPSDTPSDTPSHTPSDTPSGSSTCKVRSSILSITLLAVTAMFYS